MEKKREYYSCITGLRGIACIGIVAYHVCMLCDFQGLWIYDVVLRNFDAFVRLFFIISGFSMMCGYFRKIYYGELSLESFYVRRFAKLLPFFYFSLGVNFCITKFRISPLHLFGTATLLFGLMPTHQTSAVSAAWALGLIFIFYLLFPAFTVAVANRRRALISFAISCGLLISYLCYYGIGVENDYINIIRQSVWFVLGALIYQYREILTGLHKKNPLLYVVVNTGLFAAGILFYFIQKDFGMIVGFSGLMCLCLMDRNLLLNHKLIHKISSLSYEIYLLHVPVFRVIQAILVKRFKMIEMLGTGFFCYLLLFLLTMMAVIPSVLVAKWILSKLKNMHEKLIIQVERRFV